MYIVQVSNFVWQARMTIANVTAEENYKDHYIIVTNRYPQLTNPQLRQTQIKPLQRQQGPGTN